MPEQVKKILWIIFAVALVATVALWSIFNPGPEHIEDTNGLDNFALQQITEEDVVSLKMGSRGGLTTKETRWSFEGFEVSDGTEYSCRKFTGVYRLYSTTIIKGSDIYVYLANFQVHSGNFAFYVVLDGTIVGQVQPDDGVTELLIENIDKTATLEYIIAGESANFEFVVPSDWE